MNPIPSAALKRFFFVSGLTALVVMLGVATINLIIDPFGMFRLISYRELNQSKPAVYHRVRLMKAYDVRRIKPRVIILGTSRTHLGLRPSHEAWATEPGPVYNLAFDGATTKEMYFYLLHAQSVQALKQVVLGLDTYHPILSLATNRVDFNRQLLYEPRSSLSKITVLLADLKLLLNLDTLRESFATILAQRQSQPEWFAKNGQRLGQEFFRAPGALYREKGPRSYFDEIDKQEVRYQLEWRIPSPTQASTASDAESDRLTSLDYIEKIILFCRDQAIDLRIFITPSHAHQMEISATTGAWPSIENGKRALVKLLAADAAQHEKAFPLWDFSGYSLITTETLPPRDSVKEMSYYWESSHFKENVGDWVLDRIYEIPHQKGSIPPEFGVRLTPDNIEQELERIRQDQAAYRLTHAKEIEDIQTLVKDFVQKHHITFD